MPGYPCAFGPTHTVGPISVADADGVHDGITTALTASTRPTTHVRRALVIQLVLI
ncbi:hypothetical protein KR76_00023 [Pimelobacter simplex]|uniref:Uncharacterized protein n=1 Tax=Nocardioides simplex TaxID=2045 RepID=A0A0C5XB70_NOCSI|nr:hypothetical protein KR76_00023 [Pimelobacter simplex]